MPQATSSPDQALERPEGIMHRSLSGEVRRVRADGDDDTAIRYEFTASSNSPVEMWGRVFEILDHSETAVRLDWLNSGNAPMLGMHSRYDQVGVIESARLDGNKIIVTVRIAPSQKDLIADLDAGVVRNVSIGYRVHDEKLESREQDENGNTIRSTWRVTDWEPNEVSFVSIPADRTVGIGRSDEETAQLKTRVMFLNKQLETNSEPTNPDQTDPNPQRSQPNTTMPQTAPAPSSPSTIEVGAARQQREDAVTSERKRVAAITALVGKARESNLGDHTETANTFINEGRSVEEFQRHVLDNVSRTPGVTTGELGCERPN